MVGLFFVGGLNPNLADRDEGRLGLVVRGFAVPNDVGQESRCGSGADPAD